MIISVINKAAGNTAEYARKEFVRFLSVYTNHIITCSEDADRFYILDLSDRKDNLEEYAYAIKSGTHKSRPALYISGGSESALLSGVYEALGMMGIFFNIDGQVLKSAVNIETLDKTDKKTIPFCRHRGIRQHINFPMDISSYHPEDAKEYIRNLARMRMNSITFHSYTGQWHGYRTKDTEVYAGNFFYGQRHDIPKYEALAGIVSNRDVYCIPEIENNIGDDKLRSAFAVYWLNEVMSAAKEAGMNIILSIEVPGCETQDTQIDICRNVLQMYPHIDALELISPEGGGTGETFTLEDLCRKAFDMFGGSVLTNGKLPYIPDEMPSSLPGAMASLKRAVDLYNIKDRIFAGMQEKPLHIGLYVMCKETLKVLKNILDTVLPEEVIRTFLSAHGSRAVAGSVGYMDFSYENWQNTLLYSWIEFDGSMYLQQNSCEGIKMLLDAAKVSSKNISVYGICLNHWRTAENAMTISYAAEAMIHPLKTSDFYKQYADVYGIKDREAFSDVMTMLGDTDTFLRDRLFNIGFCYLGCWLWPKGLGWIRAWDVNNMDLAQKQFEDEVKILYKCLENTADQNGIRKLRFLINRIKCSILQIKAIKKLLEIAVFADDENPEKLSEPQKNSVLSICDEAMQFSRQYVDKHIEMIEDRGCEGTAVSYCATIPTYIDHIKHYFAYGETECSHKPGTFDKPPAPDTAFL